MKRATHRDPEQLRAEFWSLASDEALVDRATAGAAAHLSKKSMNLMATRGDGPPYRIGVGNKALYRKGDVLAWLQKRGQTVRASAERPVRRPAPAPQ